MTTEELKKLMIFIRSMNDETFREYLNSLDTDTKGEMFVEEL